MRFINACPTRIDPGYIKFLIRPVNVPGNDDVSGSIHVDDFVAHVIKKGISRPPGHHAEENEPMGFCLYNNVAIATSFLLNQKELGINKILIVDWDVHHGNRTPNMFWKDPRVLFFSVHRHERGYFYPAGDDGSHFMMGEGPVAKEFKPDIILMSARFDAGCLSIGRVAKQKCLRCASRVLKHVNKRLNVRHKAPDALNSIAASSSSSNEG
ncbi:histone deacetylase 5 [Tanacetum coccineum]|uniref:Histone deacetylase 5 n=1 Tax=Tanacetum coccineum TaxID=301880 RepID=A0ABQ5A4P7_9ASTR